MRRLVEGLLLIAMMSSVSASAAGVDEKLVRAAKTTTDLKGLGGAQLSGATFGKRVVGRKLDEGTWTWKISPDGTTYSVADDKSWETRDTWSFKGDKYCRKVKSRDICSEVWMVGPFLRMTDKGANLSAWTVQVK